MADMSVAEKIIRAEPTEELKKLRDGLLKAFSHLPNPEAIVDRDYAMLKDELSKRGAL